MRIVSLQVSNLRIIEHCSLEPAPGLNWIIGANGAGKTSILEGIYLAGRGRTFRHAEAGPMIRHGADHVQVIAGLAASDDREGQSASLLGVRRERRRLVCRLDGQTLHRRSQLAEALPLQWLGSQPQTLLNSGPDTRRRFVDKGLFHVEQSYLPLLGDLQRCYLQRNAALKTGQARQVEIWDRPFVEAAQAVTARRRQFVQALGEGVGALLDAWQASFRVSVRYRQGWPEDKGLDVLLAERRGQELQFGFTAYGPQRADLELATDLQVAEKQLSRGQQKVLVFALNLALVDLIRQHRGAAGLPILLIDDFAAELDVRHQELLIAQLSARGLQAFITVIERNALAPSICLDQVFHVEQGALK
jgi:DNA replication and repair protein RecF